MENNNLLKIFRQKFLRNAKHAISARGSSVDQQNKQNALAPIRRVGSCKEGDYIKFNWMIQGKRFSLRMGEYSCRCHGKRVISAPSKPLKLKLAGHIL